MRCGVSWVGIYGVGCGVSLVGVYGVDGVSWVGVYDVGSELLWVGVYGMGWEFNAWLMARGLWCGVWSFSKRLLVHSSREGIQILQHVRAYISV